jgi:amino acid permease
VDGVLGCIRKDDIMAGKKSEFDKVFSAWDILVIAFGAMIGWGWVVSSGDWITRGGVIGAAIGFALGGVMVFFVGLTYAELTAAMPQCGGERFPYLLNSATASVMISTALSHCSSFTISGGIIRII